MSWLAFGGLGSSGFLGELDGDDDGDGDDEEGTPAAELASTDHL